MKIFLAFLKRVNISKGIHSPGSKMKNYDKLSQSPIIDLPFKRVIVLMMENQTYDRLLGFVDGVETKDLKHYFQKSSVNPETKIFCTPNADPLKDHSWDPPHGHDDIVKLTEIKIKRISKFDSDKAEDNLLKIEEGINMHS